MDSDESHVRSLDSIGLFRTRENAVEEGWHEWETNWRARWGSDWRATGLSCQTTLLRNDE